MLPYRQETPFAPPKSCFNFPFFRIGYDGGDPVKLVDEFCFTFNITEDEKFLFYQIDGGDDNRLVCLDLTTGISRTIMDGNFKLPHKRQPP